MYAIDEKTIRIENFSYDGTGISKHLNYIDYCSYASGIPLEFSSYAWYVASILLLFCMHGTIAIYMLVYIYIAIHAV